MRAGRGPAARRGRAKGTRRHQTRHLRKRASCLRKDLRPGSMSRDVVSFLSELCRRRSCMFTEFSRLVPPGGRLGGPGAGPVRRSSRDPEGGVQERGGSIRAFSSVRWQHARFLQVGSLGKKAQSVTPPFTKHPFGSSRRLSTGSHYFACSPGRYLLLNAPTCLAVEFLCLLHPRSWKASETITGRSLVPSVA